jgi:hypothetical protein
LTGTYDTEPICGRPLGIRRLNASHLVVADAYLGIFVLEFSNGDLLCHFKILFEFNSFSHVCASIFGQSTAPSGWRRKMRIFQ